jgi:uncharacterized repeat protein (TIGR03943 family)
MTLDGRALRLAVLWAWALFFLWLWLSDEVLRYLGPRTEWVVVVGAIGLSAVALVYGRADSKDGAGSLPSAAEIAGSIGLLLPIALAMILSGSTLGSLAASKKLAGRGVDLAALARLQSGSSEITFLDLKAAADDPEWAREKGLAPGKAVRLTGFITRPVRAGRDSFELSRFYITCCVADAIPVGVEVETAASGPTPARKDEWFSVTGVVVRQSDGLGLRALRVKRVAEPDQPYLSFAR